MRALKLGSFPEVIDFEKDIRLTEKLIGCEEGCVQNVCLSDDAILLHGIDAERRGRQRNDIASLIARKNVYGTALVIGDGEDDVPDAYLVYLS